MSFIGSSAILAVYSAASAFSRVSAGTDSDHGIGESASASMIAFTTSSAMRLMSSLRFTDPSSSLGIAGCPARFLLDSPLRPSSFPRIRYVAIPDSRARAVSLQSRLDLLRLCQLFRHDRDDRVPRSQ